MCLFLYVLSVSEIVRVHHVLALLELLHLLYCIHDGDSFVSLGLRLHLLLPVFLFLFLYCVQQVASLFLENPVGEGEAAGLVLPIGQVFEKLGDDAGLFVSALVQDDVKELSELDHT